MARGHSDPAPRNHSGAIEVLRGAFWTIALAVIAGYAFFALVGAFSITDAVAASLLVAVLALLWTIHAASARRRHHDEQRDPRMRAARQRRGF